MEIQLKRSMGFIRNIFHLMIFLKSMLNYIKLNQIIGSLYRFQHFCCKNILNRYIIFQPRQNMKTNRTSENKNNPLFQISLHTNLDKGVSLINRGFTCANHAEEEIALNQIGWNNFSCPKCGCDYSIGRKIKS